MLDEIIAFDEAKKCFKESENREADLNNTKDLVAVSAIQVGIVHGYKISREKYYVVMCEDCGYRNATCFGPGAYCEECSMNQLDEEEE